MQIYWLKIKNIIEENSEVRTYLLDCPEDFTWKEGAHTHFALEGFEDEKTGRSMIRHMSISTLRDENSIGITTRVKNQASEFKEKLRTYKVGDEVALFKTISNVPLKREDKNIFLLSSGVGLATFRPLVLEYFKRADNVSHMHSLNIDSSKEFLFPDVFKSATDKKFTSEFIDNRKNYYEKVKNLASDKNGLFYVVGSDEFLVQNIKVLLEQGIRPEQIILDKYEEELPEFFIV